MANTITFGKYKGADISTVPDAYLIWVLRSFDKSHWLGVARDELVKRGKGAICDNGTSVRVEMANGRFEVVKNPALVAISFDDPDGPFGPTESLPPNWNQSNGIEKAFASGAPPRELLRQHGKLGVPFIVSEGALASLQEHVPSDLAVLSTNVMHGASLLGQEAAIYGSTEEEKWIRTGLECQVKLVYLGMSWQYSCISYGRPQLQLIEKALP